MSSSLRLATFFAAGLAFALPASAQLDSGALRAKFGEPLHRETFHVPAGFDVVVDYGPSADVCQLQVPALMPTTETVANLDVMNQRMRTFLQTLVPDSMRSKELRRFMAQLGAAALASIEYEHVTVSESMTADRFHDTITVHFKNSNCPSPSGP